ncbi:MAG: hypothetical protein ACX936_15690 [Marinobacter sp.]
MTGYNRNYLWFLSRTPNVSPEAFEAFEDRARDEWFIVDDLVNVEQNLDPSHLRLRLESGIATRKPIEPSAPRRFERHLRDHLLVEFCQLIADDGEAPEALEADALISDAVSARATDLHLEPFPDH